LSGRVKMSNDERTVQLTGVSREVATRMLGEEGRMVEGTEEDVARAVPDFRRVNYPSFVAEHAVINGDLHVHFFLPTEAGDLKRADANLQRKWEAYWLETFPKFLSPVAKEYFQSDKPRLVAKYTEEVASWWFCGRGYGDALNPDELALGFERALDGALQASTA